MLDRLHHWWLSRQVPAGWEAARAWAQAQGWTFKVTKEGDGFVIEPDATLQWRLEWGPSHRRYLGAHELRLRGESSVEPETLAVVMPRALLEALERELFEAFTEGVQTRVDDSLPPEVRWLALAERLPGSALGDLRERLAAVGNLAPWLGQWLAGSTGVLLADALSQSAHGEATPMSLSLQQGQVVLRVGLATPDASQLAQWTQVFRVALDEARALPAGDSVE